MIISYVHIFAFLFIKSRQNSMGQGPDGRRAENLHNASMNILKTMVTVCLLFFLCWVGNFAFVLIAFGIIKPFFDTPWYHLTTYLTFVNCTVSPIIYSIQYQDFQNAARKVFCGLKETKPERGKELSTVSSKTNSSKISESSKE